VQEQKSFASSCPRALLDHPIRSRQHVGRNREADLFGGLEVDDEFEFPGLLYGQVCGLGSFKYFIDVNSGLPIVIGRIIELAAKNRLPAIYPSREYAEAGGLMSYGPDLIEARLQNCLGI
jgi:hypothetical protein